MHPLQGFARDLRCDIHAAVISEIVRADMVHGHNRSSPANTRIPAGEFLRLGKDPEPEMPPRSPPPDGVPERQASG